MRSLPVKIVWAITGAGDLLTEVIDELKKLSDAGKVEITTCLSKAGYMVARWYQLIPEIKGISKKVLIEHDANTPLIIGPLQTGKYHSLLVAPATGNTVSKIVHGIADTLITNAVSQTQKGGFPVHILPVDMRPGEMITRIPSGKEIKLVTRDIDVDNVRKLKAMKETIVLESPRDIGRIYSADQERN